MPSTSTILLLLLAAIGAVGVPVNAASSDPLAAWKDLVNLRPDSSELQAARSQRGRQPIDASIQRIENAQRPTANFDEYSVSIVRLPTRGPQTADELFQYVRRNLHEFMDDGLATFKPYSEEDRADWRVAERAPIGSAMLFVIPLWNVPGNPLQERGAVVTTQSSRTSWTFSTVKVNIAWPGEHPVSGNREFGLSVEEGSLGRIYTRGADRAVGGRMEVVSEETVFRGADALWNGFQRNLRAFVERNGGEVRINPPIIRRPPWNSPEVASLLGKSVADLRVEKLLNDRLRQRESTRWREARLELERRPIELKRGAWTYLANAVKLACANPSSFERRYAEQKLPGAQFNKADFDRFMSEDAQKRPPPNPCQSHVMEEMKRIGHPVRAPWIAESADRFRRAQPTLFSKLGEAWTAASQAMESFLTSSSGTRDYDRDHSPEPRTEPTRSSQTEEQTPSEARGIRGSTRSFNFNRFDPDQGPGSTLGR